MSSAADPSSHREGSISTGRDSSTVIRERRYPTVLLCDIVNSVGLERQLGTEDYDVLQQRVFSCIEAAVYLYRSTDHTRYDRTVGDSRLFCFGLPVAGERDAELAVEAAVRVRDAVKRLPQSPGVVLTLHIGVATGEVVARMNPPPGDSPIEVVGAPNLAARLHKCAPPGAIVISDATRLLVEKRFHCRDLGAFDLHGLGMTRAWEVVRRRRADELDSQLAASPTPFVGREIELARLLSAWREASDGMPAAMLVVGEAGVGKSRLVSEFRKRAQCQSDQVITLRCSQLHKHTPFFPIVMLLERLLGPPRNYDRASKRSKLRSIFFDELQRSEEALSVIEDLLVRLPRTTADEEAGDAMARRKLCMDVLVQLLLQSARRHTRTLVIVEDAQWADASTLEVLQRATDHKPNGRVLFVLTGRPEFLESPMASPYSDRIALTALTPTQSAILVSRIDGNRHLTSGTIEKIVSRCDGIPLYLEQMMLRIQDALEDAPVPPTPTAPRARS